MSAVIKESPTSTRVGQFLATPKKLLIDGKWVAAASGKTFEVKDPATAATIARVAEGDKADVDLAVQAARRAFESGPWASMTPSDRGKLIWRIGELISRHVEELAELESLDNGKPMAVAHVADVPLAADIFQYMAGWSTKIEGKTIPLSVLYTPGAQYHSYTRPEPIGVVGQIIPWNFPLLMLAWKWGPALACGNTVVMKLAEQTPLTGMRIAEMALEAGFPDGVINVLNGYGETTGAALVAHPDVDKIAFTGHFETAKIIQKSAADTLKRTTFELGGKSPNVIFADCNLEQAVDGAFHAIYFHGGQCCTAGSRLFVEEKIHSEFVR
ncbi:MAG TPA: aldehyde dehydrogenase family protein, partial [Steroidobacteraceae bacterium]